MSHVTFGHVTHLHSLQLVVIINKASMGSKLLALYSRLFGLL